MEPEFSPNTENRNAHQARGSNSGGGVPVVGKRIYVPPGNGKTCHQCRQTIKGFAVRCKNPRNPRNPRNGKPCPLKYCYTCLAHRNGEDAHQAYLLDDWHCPKCRGKCNCSVCRGREGKPPTGPLWREAKASGFTSVSELLDARAAANLEEVVLGESGEGLVEISNNTSADDACQKDETNCESLLVIEADGAAGVVSQDEIFDAISNEEAEAERNIHSTVMTWSANDYYDPNILTPNNGYVPNPQSAGDENTEEEIPLPWGTPLKEILGIEFPPENARNALQFLEFCTMFRKPLDMKKGEAETVLRELIRKQNLRGGDYTLAVELQTRLLTLIHIDSRDNPPSLTTTDGNNSWLKALGDLASQSPLVPKDFPYEMLNEGLSGYCNLSLPQKLSVLNFICDEALCSTKLRSYMAEEKLKIEQQEKEAKAQVAAAKKKEKSLKQKLQEEIAKKVQSNGDPVLLSEQDALVLKLTTEVAQAHSEVLEAKGKTSKRKISEAMRTEPVFVDGSGQTFWKLKSYEVEDAVLLQDIKIQDGDGTAIEERWFVYGSEKKHEIDKYISSRAKRSKLRKGPHKLSNESSKANMWDV